MGTWPSPITSLDELAFTFVDVETTGLDPATGDRVCEIALLRVQGDREIARFESLVHPQMPMHPGALAVHGITDAMLVGAPIFATLLPQIHALLQRYRFRHNSLGAIAGELGVTPTARHRAMADVCTTWQVWQRFVADMRQEGPVILAHVLYPHSRRPVEELIAMVTTLQEALPTGKPLQLRYQPEKAPATVRVVQPLEVYYERGHGYMRAFCHLRQEERHFRLDRIAELKVLHEG